MPDQLWIDGLQYCRWDRGYFESLRAGGAAAVHVTLVYHETARETLSRFAEWERHFEQHGDLITPARSAADIRAARAAGKVAILFGAQNCSPIEDDIGLVAVLRRLGLSIMQLTYNNQSLLAAGCYEAADSGVTRFGQHVIEQMNRVGMIIDMSHSAERSTLHAIDLSARPICISHANPSAAHPALRNKSDAVLRALTERGGLLGFSLYPLHLPNGSQCTLAQFCRMVADAAERYGVEHLGLGSDLCQNQPQQVLEWMRNGRWSRRRDYGEGSADSPGWPDALPWFPDTSGLRNIERGLLAQGFSAPETAAIMGGNWLRFLDDGLQPR